MQTQNECLTAAMYIASESYSGSAYETNQFQDMGCDDMPTFTLYPVAADRTALAA